MSDDQPRSTDLSRLTLGGAASVVAFPTRGPAAPEHFAAVAQVIAHWTELRGNRAMPERHEIDPRALPDALEFLFLAETVAPTVARLRLAGPHLSQLLGMEPRGMPLTALFEPTAREEIGLAIKHVQRHKAHVLLPLRAERSLFRPSLQGMLALMPLYDPLSAAPRLLGVIETKGALGRAPRRLSLTGPMRALGSDATDGAASDSPQTARHLRVIQGGRA